MIYYLLLTIYLEEESGMDSMMSVSTFVLAVVFTAFGTALAWLFFYLTGDLVGAKASVERVVNTTNEVLSAWAKYAEDAGLQEYPVVGVYYDKVTDIRLVAPECARVRIKRSFTEVTYRVLLLPVSNPRVRGTYITFELVSGEDQA